jgi:hypothetical protein
VLKPPTLITAWILPNLYTAQFLQETLRCKAKAKAMAVELKIKQKLIYRGKAGADELVTV